MAETPARLVLGAMDGRTLLMILVMFTLTVVILGAWRTSAMSRECARNGGSYSVLEKRCINTKPQPRVILQRELLRT